MTKDRGHWRSFIRTHTAKWLLSGTDDDDDDDDDDAAAAADDDNYYVEFTQHFYFLGMHNHHPAASVCFVNRSTVSRSNYNLGLV